MLKLANVALTFGTVTILLSGLAHTAIKLDLRQVSGSSDSFIDAITANKPKAVGGMMLKKVPNT